MKSNHSYNYNHKLDELYSREKSYDLHKRKLEEIRSKKSVSMDQQHLQLLAKRNHIREQRRRFDLLERSDQINRGNSQLYQKITEIGKRPMNADYFLLEDEKVHHHLNLTFRKLQAQQIQHENIKLASRLIRQEPVLKLNEFKQSYKDSKKLMLRLLKHQQFQQFAQQIRYGRLLDNVSKRKQFHASTLPRSNREHSNSKQQKLDEVKTQENRIDLKKLERTPQDIIEENPVHEQSDPQPLNYKPLSPPNQSDSAIQISLKQEEENPAQNDHPEKNSNKVENHSAD